MKIGTCVVLADIEEMQNKFKTLQQNRFSTCQLICWNTSYFTDEYACHLIELMSVHNIVPSAFWCGWEGPQVWDFYDGQLTLGLVPPEFRAVRVKNLCDGADFAKKLGISDVITHMGFIPENPNDPNFEAFCVAVRTVAEHLKKNSQNLLFETGQETPVTMLRCFEKVGTDNLGINLDTANLILYGRGNPVDALEVFGKYVRNIHAKDGCFPINGHDLGVETRLGDGYVDFKALFTKLRNLGYDTHVTIEREIEGEEQLNDVLYARNYLQLVIDEVYGN